MLPPDRPLLAATLRALPAGLLLVACCWWPSPAGARRPRSGARSPCSAPSTSAPSLPCSSWPPTACPGGVAATLGAIQPLLAAGLAALLLAERIRGRTLLTGAMGMVGVELLVLRADAALDGWGVAAGLAGTSCMAMGVVLTKRWGRSLPLLAMTGWQLVAGGLVLTPLMLFLEGLPPALTAENVAGHVWLGVAGTALAYSLWFRGVEALPVQQVSLLGLCSPLVATAVGWLVLDQSLAGGQIAGAALVLTALRIGQTGAGARRLRRRRQAVLPGVDAMQTPATFPFSREAGRVATRPGGPAAGTLRP